MLSRPCSLVLKSLGWTLNVDWPASRKYVLVVYPHTSNWDFLLGVCAAKAIRLDAHYIGKHTLFRKPYGWFFRSLGGIPVDRRRKASLAQQLAERFDEADEFILGLAPDPVHFDIFQPEMQPAKNGTRIKCPLGDQILLFHRVGVHSVPSLMKLIFYEMTSNIYREILSRCKAGRNW